MSILAQEHAHNHLRAGRYLEKRYSGTELEMVPRTEFVLL